MNFDVASFNAKVKAIADAMPAVATLVQTAQLVAPGAVGLTKAGLVINTVIAVEPALVGMEQVLAAAISGLVTAFKTSGQIATPAQVAPSSVVDGSAAPASPTA